MVTYDEGEFPPTLSIDEEQCRDGEDNLNSTVAEGGVKGLSLRVIGVQENA